MNHVAYLYTGPNADAARHLVAHSSLKTVTKVTPDYPWAGANAEKVELTVPREQLDTAGHQLWHVLEDLAFGDSVMLDIRANTPLSFEDRAAVYAALGLALLGEVDVDVNPEQVA